MPAVPQSISTPATGPSTRVNPGGQLVVEDEPLAWEAAAIVDQLIADKVPPVSAVDPETAQTLNAQAEAAVAAMWRPDIEDLPVQTTEVVRDGVGTVRVHTPTQDVLGTLLWVHGGGWMLGDAVGADPIARTLADLMQCQVIAVDHRQAPQHPFPEGLEDVEAALNSLLVDESVDKPLLIGGDSSGANLAAAAISQSENADRLAGQILIYPAVDPTSSLPSVDIVVGGPMISKPDMEYFIRYYAQPEQLIDPRIALLGAVDAIARVPALVLTVGHDPLRDEGLQLAQALADAGDVVNVIHAPELFHGSLTSAGVMSPAMARLRQVAAEAVRLFLQEPI